MCDGSRGLRKVPDEEFAMHPISDTATVYYTVSNYGLHKRRSVDEESKEQLYGAMWKNPSLAEWYPQLADMGRGLAGQTVSVIEDAPPPREGNAGTLPSLLAADLDPCKAPMQKVQLCEEEGWGRMGLAGVSAALLRRISTLLQAYRGEEAPHIMQQHTILEIAERILAAIGDQATPLSMPYDAKRDIQALVILAMTGADEHMANTTDVHGPGYTETLAEYSCSIEAYAKLNSGACRTMEMNGDDGWIRPVVIGNGATHTVHGFSVLTRMGCLASSSPNGM